MKRTNYDREIISVKKRFEGYPEGVIPMKGVVTVIRDGGAKVEKEDEIKKED